ncbi:MAG TPA: phospho-N-acetylmuramoyl-pentapeptide-transferase [Clostridiales bacterium]|jgi:phospho-N-acetylmuramoyl-pentapeptide-transferase|nr:phospho-N-acetylmuramoyl-pentapeptide-transferase [Clostridiales bacterium]
MTPEWMVLCGSAVTAFFLSFIVGHFLIPKLRKIKMGQKILEIGPRWHKSKEGTPTMGGIMFIVGSLVSSLAFGLSYAIRGNDMTMLVIWGMMLLYGAIGFMDDYIKFVKKRNKGLSANQKLVMQFAVAGAFLFALYSISPDFARTAVRIPFTDTSIELGVSYYIFSLFFIVFVVNSVNITDGIDGLAGSVTFIISVFYAICAMFLDGILPQPMMSVYGSLAGALIGFLCYNIYPARVFMGDTGSLFLGGAVVAAAYWLNNPLIIVIGGLIYILEALSVVIQVSWYKLTHKRVFKMAPLHHHFEMCGWKENAIVITAVCITTLLSVLSYFGI